MSTAPQSRPPLSNPSLKVDPAAEFARTHEVSEAVTSRLKALTEPVEETHSTHRKRRPLGLIIGLAALVLGLGGVTGYYFLFMRGENAYEELTFERVNRGKLVLSVVEKGELEASKNTDIVVKVRASGRGQSIASSIKWLIDEGSRVKEGDVICRLDDAGLKEQMKNQEITVEGKKSALITAQKDEEITAIQYGEDVKTAEKNLDLARIDLEKYVGKKFAHAIYKWSDEQIRDFITWDNERLSQATKTVKSNDEKADLGEFEKTLSAKEGELSLAEANFLQARQKVEWSRKMVKLGYLGTSQVQQEENRLNEASAKRDVILKDRSQMLQHDAKRTILDFINKIKQAEAQVAIKKKELEGKTAQSKAKREEAESVLAAEKTKLEDLKEDIEHCTIRSPGEGMIVYHVDERSRWGGGGTQNNVAVNESVREGQKLMRIPDLRQMQVKVKVHEGVVARMALGLPARVKIAGLESVVTGTVKEVSPVASSQDWSMSDVRVYPATVLLEDSVDTLKPGMSAEVTVLIEDLNDVLRLPVHAVLETAGRKFCYVRTDSGVEKRFLATGLNNTKFVEVKESDGAPAGVVLRDGEKFGVKEGEQVLMNPRGLAERLGDLHAENKDPGEGLQIDPTKVQKKPTGNGTEGSKRPRGEGKPGSGRGQGGPGGPGAGGPGGGGGARPGGAFQMSPEDAARQQKLFNDLKEGIKNAKAPADKKKILDKYFTDQEKAMKDRGLDDSVIQGFFPRVKENVKKRLADEGIEVPD